MTPLRRSYPRWVLTLAVGVVALSLAGCGGGSSSSTGPSTTAGALKRLEVEIEGSASAQAPARSLLARVASLLGWPRVAEASHETCTVTAGPGAESGFTGPTTSGSTDPDHKVKLTDVGVDSAGQTRVEISCNGALRGFFVLTGGTAGTVVTVKVKVGPDRIVVRTKEIHISPSPSASKPSEVSPSPSKKGG